MRDVRSAARSMSDPSSKNDAPDWFHVTESALSSLAEISLECRLPRRATIFEQDSSANSLYWVRQGQVKIYSTSGRGRVTICRIALRGDLLGLSAILNQLPHEATAETLEETTVRTIPLLAFKKLLTVSNEISMMAARALAREHRETFEEARRMSHSVSIGGRLAGFLLNNANYAPASVQPVAFRMLFTHEELANMVGTSRETITRLLNRYERDGLIARRGATVRILNPVGLASLAGE